MVGRRIDELPLPSGAQIGAIVRTIHDAEVYQRVKAWLSERHPVAHGATTTA